jgi:hypothetical protein
MESVRTWARRSVWERSIPSSQIPWITGSFVRNVWAASWAEPVVRATSKIATSRERHTGMVPPFGYWLLPLNVTRGRPSARIHLHVG